MIVTVTVTVWRQNNLNELTVTMRVTCGDKCSLNKNTLTVCDSERNSDRKGK